MRHHRGARRRALATAGTLATAAALAAGSPAGAQVPGGNGTLFLAAPYEEPSSCLLDPTAATDEAYVKFCYEGRGAYQATWAPDGRRVVYVGADQAPRIVVANAADGSGRRVLVTAPPPSVPSDLPRVLTDPEFSPDGRRVAYADARSGDADVYAVNADGTGGLTRLTHSAGNDTDPTYSPDGRSIAFASERTGDGDIYVMNADGTNKVALTTGPARDSAPDWSPDGSKVAFVRVDAGADIEGGFYVVNRDGTGLRRLAAGSFVDTVSWSPDGTYLALSFTGDEVHFVNLDGTLAPVFPRRGENNFVSPDGTYLLNTAHVVDWQPQPCTIRGTPGPDTLTGTAGPDVVCGFGGGDTIRGLGGNDTLLGYAGADRLDGGDGGDTVVGFDGDDRLVGGAGADRCDGGPGADTASGCEKTSGVP